MKRYIAKLKSLDLKNLKSLKDFKLRFEKDFFQIAPAAHRSPPQWCLGAGGYESRSAALLRGPGGITTRLLAYGNVRFEAFQRLKRT